MTELDALRTFYKELNEWAKKGRIGKILHGLIPGNTRFINWAGICYNYEVWYRKHNYGEYPEEARSALWKVFTDNGLDLSWPFGNYHRTKEVERKTIWKNPYRLAFVERMANET